MSVLKFYRRAHATIRAQTFTRDDFTCAHCGWRPEDHQIPENYDGRRAVGFWPHPHADRILQLDHIIPVALGGAVDDPDNMQTLCEPCNLTKGARYCG